MDEQTIEIIGTRLANRAYLFRVFHIIFGAEPSEDELKTLSDQATLNAFEYLKDQVQNDQRVTLTDDQEDAVDSSATEILTHTLEHFVALGAKIGDAEYIDSLKSAYTRLFLVPGESYVYPWESPYVGTTAVIFTQSTLDVRKRFRAEGFVAQEYHHFPEDHIAMMLDFLAHLSNRAFDAFGDGDDEEFVLILDAQKQFISLHLTNWLHSFQEDLDKKDGSGIYSQFTRALRVFLKFDELFLEDVLSRKWL